MHNYVPLSGQPAQGGGAMASAAGTPKQTRLAELSGLIEEHIAHLFDIGERMGANLDRVLGSEPQAADPQPPPANLAVTNTSAVMRLEHQANQLGRLVRFFNIHGSRIASL
jgi:hypothetical protein